MKLFIWLCITWIVTAGGFAGIKFKSQTLSETKIGAQKVRFYDLDLDGDPDILSGSKTLYWWENRGNGIYKQHRLIEDAGNTIGFRAIDLDGDRDIDLITAAHAESSIVFWENLGNMQYRKRVVDRHFPGAHDVAVSDINMDGHADIIGTRGDKNGKGEIAVWIQSPEGFKKSSIFSGEFCHSVSVGDLDGDGRNEIVATQFKEGIRIWQKQEDMKFRSYFLKLHGAHEVSVRDMDGDNIPDILAAGYMSNRIIWWKNDGAFHFKAIIVSDQYLGAVTVSAGDLDGDGDIDILAAAHGANDIRWWENRGKDQYHEHSIAGFLFSASGVDSTDINGDGRVDIVGSAWRGKGQVRLWLNRGNQTEKYNIEKNWTSEAFIRYLRAEGISKATNLYNKFKNPSAGRLHLSKRQLNFLGYEFLRLRHFEKAIDTFRLLVTAFPQYANGYDSLGEAYMKSGQKQQAIKFYNKALEIDPENRNAKEQLLILDGQKPSNGSNFKQDSAKAIRLWRNGQKKEAITTLRQALQRYPEEKYRITRNLIAMYTRLGQQDKVFETYRNGHKNGLYYPLYVKSGPNKKLMQYPEFRMILNRNRELIREAEKKSKAKWEVKTAAKLDPKRTYPLLVVLHGWSGNLERINRIWIPRRHNQQLITAYLQSSQIAGIDAYCWDNIERTHRDIKNLVRTLSRKYRIDQSKIILAGFSQGASAAIKIALENPAQYAGFIAHCPGGIFLQEIQKKTILDSRSKGVLLSTEKDHNKDQQQQFRHLLKSTGFKYRYIDIEGIGHWYPQNFYSYLDQGLDLFLN